MRLLTQFAVLSNMRRELPSVATNDNLARCSHPLHMSQQSLRHPLQRNNSQSSLKTWGLIQEKEMGKGEPPSWVCDPYIRNWLLDISNLDKSLVGIAKVQDIKPPLSNWHIKEAVDFVKQSLAAGGNMPIRFFVAGAEGTGRRTLSACVAQALRLPLLTINSDGVAEQDWQQTFMRAQRLACLDGFALAWKGQNILKQPWKTTQPAPMIQFIIGEVDESMPNTEGVLDYRIEML